MPKVERRRKIYLAARHLFSGDEGDIRERSSVLSIVNKNKDSFRDIIKQFSESSVVDIILTLLKERVFQSELRAKLTFPELFQPSPERSLQHAVSEQEAVRSETDALRRATAQGLEALDAEPAGNNKDVEEPTAPLDASHQPSGDRLSLFPIYLTYETQHMLLNYVQNLLETCCYTFAVQWLPTLVQERGWECAENVELGSWAGILPSRYRDIPKQALAVSSEQDLRFKLQATHRIRHAAVHRLQTNSNDVQKMLKEATELAQALKDMNSSMKLEILAQHVRVTMKDLELHKNNLENELDTQITELESQMRELERRMKEAKDATLQQNTVETRRICQALAGSIRDVQSVDDGVLNNEQDTAIGNDITLSYETIGGQCQ